MSVSSRPYYIDEAEGRALAVRGQLGLGSDASGNVFELMGHLGLNVVRWPMRADGPDGFYIRKGELAVIAVNSDKRLGRQRFTVCHELGHHLFDRQSCIDRDIFDTKNVPERRANAFAAYFLMPREGVQRWIERSYGRGQRPGTLDAATMVHLGHHFGASFEATLYHLHNLGRLRQHEVEELKKVQPERIARRMGYDLAIEEQEWGRAVLPPDFVRRALQAYASGDISLARLAELLRTDERSARQLAEEAGAEPAAPAIEDIIDEARRA